MLQHIFHRINLQYFRDNLPVNRDSDLGFHGDQYLLNIVDPVLDSSSILIETGTNVGQTLRYVADRYPKLPSVSCEPDQKSYQQALDRLAEYDQSKVIHGKSQKILDEMIGLIGDQDLPFFFLDAHGNGFKWPLKYEIRTITSTVQQGVILINDSLVPGRPQFTFDEYDQQICSIEYIRDELEDSHDYTFIYPAYRARTSNHHPLRDIVLFRQYRS